MNLSQVKLVVTDMDGTLLNSKGEVSDNFYSIFKELKHHNIHFIAASGRQYHSIIDKLHDIKDEITVIAENGGIAKQGKTQLLSNYFPIEVIHQLIVLLRTIDDAHIVLCGENYAYVESKDDDFIFMFSEYYTQFKLVEDLTEVLDDNFLKIAVYSFGGSEEFVYPHVKNYENDLQVKISGNNWLDLSHINTNKGYALQQIQTTLGISKAETMVFGDYNNDLEMLQLADYSFAMKNAHPNVKKVAKFETKSNDEGGVEFILKQLINDKELIAKSSKH
ncbi:Cof-type HAD-IIB family hydrolase [Meridianimaribacter sp. CL38]|uniref:HAD family hydrolase n=1 Tax=Meridianimaribacter sp. CL38 TaxID=2213021 RepID=UPI00103FFFDB|nr:HAD family hydrolase [Meridianimaribacter sp. CL38]TBV24827.1 Cof-type HAD-IIB family hydrolase [Meridianimaribacter sp. CL38]